MESLSSLPILQAADMVGRTRSALMKAIKTGKLSATKDAFGRIHIDAAELQRVYKVLPVANSNRADKVVHGNTELLAQLQAENAELKQQRDQWKAQSDNWMEQAQRLLLERQHPAHAATEEAPPPEKSDTEIAPSKKSGGFWTWLKS